MTTSIQHAAWLKADETRAVMAALEQARAGSARFVGGCVRNTVLAQPVDDIDIATQLTPDQTIAAAKAAGLTAVPTGIEHGTITIVANHKPYEVTTLRRDVETDGRRATVAFTESWEEDAQRRDFRLNALYASPDGVIHDPTGGGLDDVRAGRIIFIGDAQTRIREDYLRILRFFRFNAWYGRGPLDEKGLAACASLKAGIADLSVERVWKETKKLLRAPDPRDALNAMERTGIRAIALPEAERLGRLERLIALEADFFFEIDAMTRLAAALPSQASARALARRLKLSNDERDRLTAALGEDVRVVSFLSMRETRRAIYKLGRRTFEDRVMLGWADDQKDKTATMWRALLALSATWEPPVFPMNGDQVIYAGVPAGPLVGEALREVEAWWIDSDFPDDQLALVERLKAVAQALG